MAHVGAGARKSMSRPKAFSASCAIARASDRLFYQGCSARSSQRDRNASSVGGIVLQETIPRGRFRLRLEVVQIYVAPTSFGRALTRRPARISHAKGVMRRFELRDDLNSILGELAAATIDAEVR